MEVSIFRGEYMSFIQIYNIMEGRIGSARCFRLGWTGKEATGAAIFGGSEGSGCWIL